MSSLYVTTKYLLPSKRWTVSRFLVLRGINQPFQRTTGNPSCGESLPSKSPLRREGWTRALMGKEGTQVAWGALSHLPPTLTLALLPPLPVLPSSWTNYPGTGSSGLPRHPTLRRQASLLSLCWVQLCPERRGERYSTPSSGRGSRARKSNTLQDRQWLWKDVLLACHGTQDESSPRFSWTPQHAEEGSPSPGEDGDLMFGRDSDYLARDQAQLLQTPSKSSDQLTPSTASHSLLSYLLNFHAYLASTPGSEKEHGATVLQFVSLTESRRSYIQEDFNIVFGS